MMNPAQMRNLTLASAKHLVNQGHISPAKHAKIKLAVGPKPPKMAQPGMGAPKSPVKFMPPVAQPIDPNAPPPVPQMGALDAAQGPMPGGAPQMPPY
jgi:hypothetical protein